MMESQKERSRRGFDQQAGRYDHTSLGAHARQLHPLLLRQLGQIPHDRVLDVGCGTGALLDQRSRRWPAGQYTGEDLSPKMAETAQKKLDGRADILLGDAEALPLPDGRFQAVVCCDSFHHYPNPEAALGEFCRVLEPGGVLLLADTTAPAGLRQAVNLFLPLSQSGDVHLYSPGELIRLLSLRFHGVECRRVNATSFLAWGIR